MSQVVEDFMSLVKAGREGKNTGLPLGLPKLEEYIGDFAAGQSILIGAQSGVGKTSLALHSYLYRPLMSENSAKHDLHYAIFNYEMTQEQVLSKLLGIYLFEKYGEILTFKDMFSRGKKNGEPNILSDDLFHLIEDCTPILEQFASRIDFFPEAKTPEAHVTNLFTWLEKYGTFENPFGGFVENVYTPNNSEQILGVITDHLNLLAGANLKTAIDVVSNTHVAARNMCKILSFIDIMQLNRGASGDARIRQGLYEPTQSDFSDSSVAYHGSQTVLTLFNPAQVQLAKHRNYDVNRLKGRYVSLLCLKNRFGSSNIADPLYFYGECNVYGELPKPTEIYDYEMYTNPDWLISDQKTNNADNKNSNLTTFKL